MTSNSTLRLPPFGLILEAYCKEKIHFPFQIQIYLGSKAKDAVCDAKRWGNMATYLPDGESFALYRWPVDSQHVVIYDLNDRPPAFASAFAVMLLKQYHAKTVCIHSDHHPLKILRGENHHG